MTLIEDINKLLSEYYGETVAINIRKLPENSSHNRSPSKTKNLKRDRLTKAKDAISFSSNTVLIGVGEQDILADRGFSIFQDTTYFNVDPEAIFLIAENPTC